MANLNINNGVVDTNKPTPSIDARFGPYKTFEEANFALGKSGRGTITAGLTVGIIQNDGSIKEYCYQPNGSGQLELVPKDGIPINEGDTDKVLGIDENGNPVWIPKPADGDDAYGVYVKEYKEEHSGSTDGMLKRPQWLLSLKGDKGDNAVNPFKGWFDSSDDIPTQGAKKGDYAYVTTNGISKIWRHNGTTFVNTNETVSQEQTFNSNERLSAVKIDDTHLNNPVGDDETNAPTLARAEDVMQLKTKLEGVTASETKVTLTEGVNVRNGYVIGDSGDIRDNANYKYLEIPITQDIKLIRFFSFSPKNEESWNVGYAFGNYNEDNEWETKRSSRFKGNGIENSAEEYPIPAEEGAAYFRVTCHVDYQGSSSSAHFDISEFYCYLRSGESVIELIPEVANDFEDNPQKALSAKKGYELNEQLNGHDEFVLGDNIINPLKLTNTLWTFCKPTSDEDGLAVNRSPNNRSLYVRVSNVNRLFVKTNPTWYCYYAFFNKLLDISTVPHEDGNPKEEFTLKDLVDYGYLNNCHYNEATSSYRSLFTIASNTEKYIDIPEDAKYVYFVGTYYDTDNSAIESGDRYKRIPVIVKKEVLFHENGDIDNIKESVEKLENKVSNNSFVTLAQISENGEIEPSDNHVITELIPLDKGFYLSAHDGYKVDRVTLHDASGRMIGYRVRNEGSKYSFYGTLVITPNYYVRVQIGKYDGDTLVKIDDIDNIIKEYMQLDYSRLSYLMPDDSNALSAYPLFKKKLKSITNACWYNEWRFYGIRGHYGNFHENFYLPNQTWRGVVYGAHEEFSKYVGQHVSLRTYLTALLNPRSVMYTERILRQADGGFSAYGYVYHANGDLNGPFYGTVCTGLTSYLMNLNRIYYSSMWKDGAITYGTGIEVVARGNQEHPNGWTGGPYQQENEIEDIAEFVKPMDFMWKDGHCFVISDILVDHEGNRVFIVVSESTTPTAIQTIYTPEMFHKRLDGYTVADSSSYGETWRVLRYSFDANEFQDLDYTTDEDNLQYVCMNDFLQFSPKKIMIDDNITTFKGEYCAVAINTSDNSSIDAYNDFKLYLNVKRDNRFTSVEIFKEEADEENVTPIKSIDITNIEPDEILENNDDDWILIDVKEQDLEPGLYKARVKDDGNNTTGFTHFELVDIDFSSEVIENGTKTRFSFHSETGTPYLIEIQNEKGNFISRGFRWTLQDDEIENGEKDVSYVYSPSQYADGKYAKIFVKGKYGVVVARILLHNASL